MWKRSCLLLFVFGLLLCCCGASLQWDASIPDADHGAPTGYRIHRGTAPGVYDWQLDVGNALQWPIPDDLYGSYYWTTSAYNDAGSSGYSNEVFWQRAQPQYIGAANLRASKLQQGVTMAAALTGTPVTITWAAGANPAAQNITIPTDCTAVLMFFVYYSGGGSGYGLASATLNGNSYNVLTEVAGTADVTSTGVAIWWDPATGTQLLDPAWDLAPSDLSCIVAFVTGDDGSVRDSDARSAIGAVTTFSLDTNSTDLVLLFDSQDGTAPATPSGWTSRQTFTSSNLDARLSTADSPGASSTSIDGQGTNYEGIIVVSIPSVAGGASAVPANRGNVGMMLGMSSAMWLDNDFLKPTGGN